MANTITEYFIEQCEQHKDFLESWSIQETREGFYMRVKPVGSVEICCGAKKRTIAADRANVDAIIERVRNYERWQNNGEVR